MGLKRNSEKEFLVTLDGKKQGETFGLRHKMDRKKSKKVLTFKKSIIKLSLTFVANNCIFNIL